ncbi:MAG: glycosyltransferase family protein [Methanomicrobiales archaeon]|nr:glycosyltransferase family protein [Methanomicrobiales archaeon]
MIAAIVQARYGSSRLPGKVLLPLCGKPVLAHVCERVKGARLVDLVAVATTREPEDDAIGEFCRTQDVAVFRGQKDDVLGRYTGALAWIEGEQGPVDYVVRVTADCPLTDPAVIDAAVRLARDRGYGYVSNVDPPTYPDGLDVEVIRKDVLIQAEAMAHLPSDREHVTPCIRRNPQVTQWNMTMTPDRSTERWTLDTPQDYRFLSEVCRHLSPEDGYSMEGVCAVLKRHPELRAINTGIPRNTGYRTSLENDPAGRSEKP